jgi:xanthine dehydrogenase YagT iron-sulfur-binding subunit
MSTLAPLEPGDRIPVLALPELDATPAIIVFHAAAWDPATAEYVELYNRLVAHLPGSAGARLVHLRANGAARNLAFADATLTVPVIEDDEIARHFGIDHEPAVFVVDGSGVVRWRHLGRENADAVELGRALSMASASRGMASSSSSRREFVATALGVAIALMLEPTFARVEAAAESMEKLSTAARPVTLNVNGKDITLQLEPRVSLLDALREYAGMTGTKKGCDHGQCGACTVHVDNRRALSCLSFAVMQQGKTITTIEGLANGEQLHPIQQAFITHDGFQCGYCTPGQIMSASAMVNEPWGAADSDVREAMSGNLCRCGAYVGIVAAIQDVRQQKRATRLGSGQAIR